MKYYSDKSWKKCENREIICERMNENRKWWAKGLPDDDITDIFCVTIMCAQNVHGKIGSVKVTLNRLHYLDYMECSRWWRNRKRRQGICAW